MTQLGDLSPKENCRKNRSLSMSQMLCQRTVKSVIRASGVGLHSGKKVTLTLRPAAPDTGIMFRRVDLETPVDIKASALTVGDTRMCSCLDVDGVRIGTVEHLMSALCGLGIDNVWIDLDAAEVPILDGSSSPFVFLIQSAGISEQNVPKRFLRIKKPVEVREGDKLAQLAPYDGFKLNFSIVFNHPAIDRTGQQVSFDFADQGYTRDIARARTFGFTQEVEFLRENGLALGGGLENAVVLDEYRILNADGLRYNDEFVKHKVLDAIGDLYLIGHPIIGEFTAHKSGHDLNNKLARAVLADAESYEIVSFVPPAEAPVGVTRWMQQAYALTT